ncbi:MAG: universal stress protein [Pseudomonadota bacterium]
MAIKTILLHLAPDNNREGRFDAALDLARRFGAHLHIVYMTQPAHMPAAVTGRGASYAFIAEATAIAREKAAEVTDWVKNRCSEVKVSWDLDVLEGDHNKILADLGHYADLIIVSKDHGVTLDDYVGLSSPDDLLVMATTPVLMLPINRPIEPIGKKVMVAWKDTREAARAVRDSLDVLRAADEVYVMTGDRPHERFESASSLVTYLERQDIKPKQVSDVAERNIGQVILTYAEDHKIDLLIMGAYGKSRWREIIWGGATQHVLNHATIPVMMSH